MVPRRRALAALGAVAASTLLAAHTPYNQWKIFRKRFLLVHTSREDMPSDELGERITAALKESLPASRAQVVRTPTDARIASLMSTAQADVAVVSRANALALTMAAPPFEDYFATPLRVIVENATHQLVAREDFPFHHAWLIARAITEDGAIEGLVVPTRDAVTARAENTIPTHEGAAAFARGEPLPSES
jgi:hypothetical protein